MKDRKLEIRFHVCLGVAWGWGGGAGDSSGRKERWPSALSYTDWTLSHRDHVVGCGGGAYGPFCSSGQVLFCQFLWNAKGVFCFILFFVKLKKKSTSYT